MRLFLMKMIAKLVSNFDLVSALNKLEGDLK